MLPTKIQAHLEDQHGLTIKQVAYCGGGDINEARRVDTTDGVLFIKWNVEPIAGMFTAEARGLQLLADADAIRVPYVIAVHEADVDSPAYLLLEWLESGHHTATTATQLGEQLAALHHHTADQHGLDHNNFIGSLPQYNQQHTSWGAFYAQQRLQPQLEMAAERGRLAGRREQRLTWLIHHIDQFVPTDIKPALLHGDLWRGNMMVLQDGQPALIDPAVYYGHFEVELAFTELFGGFTADFYDAYWGNTNADRTGYQQRRFLYQLYPLLVHLNLFGGGYARSVDAILDQLVGG